MCGLVHKSQRATPIIGYKVNNLCGEVVAACCDNPVKLVDALYGLNAAF
jgi:hypothetical protein